MGVNMEISTKFTVATEEGVKLLLTLTSELASEKFATLVDPAHLADYKTQNFSKEVLVAELNSMSNQWIMVYADGKPAGYARITSKGTKPKATAGQTAIRIADFGVLKAYASAGVEEALLKKCLTVCRSYQHIWMHEPIADSWQGLLENFGFQRLAEELPWEKLPLVASFFMLTTPTDL